ncbi:ArsR/SmtB family transcription factor [Desulfotomaculum copahuensis]|uniref:Transcriptional regulator n=1 Tax=Desulfotomaculum copahuensis TaxID=1838280 RepID=A0A1B7LFJ8_9FIRM|nr:metalloregulator ArsR/SmtB family transcription factor [Desulfotomaculum copahuensis]OAT82921.1 transcriptional regulator [Desulfotomaculum copahuensis]
MTHRVEKDVCEEYCFNEEKVQRLRQEVERTAGLADIFKALADDTRLKIVYALAREELCVCDVANIIGATVAVASHHLRFLRAMGLARYRREGKRAYYSLDDQCVATIIGVALEHYRHRGAPAGNAGTE